MTKEEEAAKKKTAIFPNPGDWRTESARDGQCKSRGWSKASRAVPITDAAPANSRQEATLTATLTRAEAFVAQTKIELEICEALEPECMAMLVDLTALKASAVRMRRV